MYCCRSLANCPTEDTLDDNPEDLRVSLMTHQRRALAWMRWRETQTPSAGILGKTPSFLCIILSHFIPICQAMGICRKDLCVIIFVQLMTWVLVKLCL